MLKDRIYNYLVRKNNYVQYEYENYVMEHIKEHKINRLGHWIILLKLNWHYRIKKSKVYLIYDKEKNSEISKNKSNSNKNYKKSEIEILSKLDNIVEKKEDIKKSQRGNKRNINLLIKNNGGYYLDLAWDCIKDTNCYNVYYSEDNKNYKFACKVFEANGRVDNLEANKKYYIKIKYSLNGINYKDDLYISEVKTRELNEYEKIFGTKSVYMQGAESAYKPRMSAMNLAKGLMKYETISFDIFDTLIFRPFSKPSDIFILVGNKLDVMDFCKIRIDAEKEARKRAEMYRGNTEITIDDIYRVVEEKTGIPRHLGVSAEFAAEMDLCFANPYMKRVFDLVKFQGKKIVICSDMYLPSKMLDQLLKNCGYCGYSKIYVSCEYNCSKRNGKLYEIVKEYHKNIVHVGDNKTSDITMAELAGVPCIRYMNVNEKGEKFRADNMTYLTGSAYRGIVNAHLHNGINEYSPYYEMGFVYAGIYVFGFCQWIHKIANERKIEKILFLAREGDIYKKVFDQCFDDIKTEYTLWSRVPVVKTIVNKNRYPYLLQLVHHKANAIYKSKIVSLFTKIGISPLLKYLGEYRINEDEYLSPQNEKVIEKLMIDHWDELCNCYEIDLENTKKYLTTLIGNNKKIAVVDVGWSGNNVLQIKYLVEKVCKLDCDVTCLLAATRNVNETYMAGMMQENHVETYIFSNMYNKFLHDFHQNTNNRLNSFFFEIMTQSASPTFLGFGDNILQFDIPEIENYELDTEIHKGILDFALMYKNAFKKYPYMDNICGHDAYMPFRMLVSDLAFLQKYFSGFVFGRDLFATQEKAVMEIVEKAGL